MSIGNYLLLFITLLIYFNHLTFSYKREILAHVVRENDSWRFAASLVLEIECVSSSFVTQAFGDKHLYDGCTDTKSKEFSLPLPVPNALRTLLCNDHEDNYTTVECKNAQANTLADLPLFHLKAVNMCVEKSLRAIFLWCRDRTSIENAIADTDSNSPIASATANTISRYLSGSQLMRMVPFTSASRSNSTSEKIPAIRISLWDYSVVVPSNFSFKFKVSCEEVSFHIPLHRFLSKVVVAAAFNNINLQDIIYSLHAAARRTEATDSFNTL